MALFAFSAPQHASAALVTDNWVDKAPTSMSGWRADFVDDFRELAEHLCVGSLSGRCPGRRLSTYQPGNLWVDKNVQVGDGVLKLTTKKVNGSWTSGGMSSARGFSAIRGKWVVKAKFDRAYGVGYAFLLMPKGGGWPPELDIIEGTMGGPHIMSTFHYGTSSNHLQVQRWIKGVNMKVWHTYGVVMSRQDQLHHRRARVGLGHHLCGSDPVDVVRHAGRGQGLRQVDRRVPLLGDPDIGQHPRRLGGALPQGLASAGGRAGRALSPSRWAAEHGRARRRSREEDNATSRIR